MTISTKMILDLGHFQFCNDKEQEPSMDSNSNLVIDDMEDDGNVYIEVLRVT